MEWLVGLIAAAAVMMLAAAVGPSYRQGRGCLFCGRTRSEVWRFGVKVFDRIQESEWSAWVDGIHPTHTNHIWGASSTMRKGWGLTGSAGSGGIGAGGVAQIHLLRTQLGEARARALLDRYHAQLRADPGSLPQFLKTEFETISGELESHIQPTAAQVTIDDETEARNK